MVTKAVIPAAGLGTRFLPATKAVPKVMLPIIDVPMIQHVVEEAAAAGITDVFIITGRGGEAIGDHFGRNAALEQHLADRKATDNLESLRLISELGKIHVVHQDKPLGLGHAVSCARRQIGDEPFAVLLGDNVIDAKVPALRQLIDAFERAGRSIIGVEEVPDERVSSYGIIGGRPAAGGLIEVETLVEKPALAERPSNLAIAGRYVLTPGIFEALERTPPKKGGEIQLTDALLLLKEKEPVFARVIAGRRYDLGNKLEYLKAQIIFGLKRPELAGPFREFLRQAAGQAAGDGS